VQISLIIPTLNEAEGIRLAIERAWAAGADEVIVVDGGSTDDTPHIAQTCNCTLAASAAGRALQQNAGAAAAQGDVLLFQHADNYLAPQAVEQIRQALADPQIVCGAFRQKIEAPGLVYRVLERANGWRVRCLGLPYGDQSIFVRRDAFEQLGCFPEVRLMEDLIFMKKLRRIAWPVLLPGPLYVNARRWRKHGPIRQTLRNWRILTAYRFGASPEQLARLYPRHDQ